VLVVEGSNPSVPTIKSPVYSEDIASSLFDFPSFSCAWRLLNGVVVNKDTIENSILLKVK
ncbi:TPA: hypothetical protein ACHWPT_003072, partial [Legionella pneumophila]